MKILLNLDLNHNLTTFKFVLALLIQIISPMLVVDQMQSQNGQFFSFLLYLKTLSNSSSSNLVVKNNTTKLEYLRYNSYFLVS